MDRTEFTAAVEAWFNSKLGGMPSCPQCNSEVSHVSALLELAPSTLAMPQAKGTYPVLTMECPKCAFVLLFNAAAIGFKPTR